MSKNPVREDSITGNPPASDTLIRFLLPGASTRGAIIQATHLRAEACRVHGLAEKEKHAPGELFAQSLVASILMLSISKGGVRQVLQLDGTHSPIKRILAETGSGAVRGYVDWNEGVSTQGNAASPVGWLGSPVTISSIRDPGFGQPYVSSVQSEADYLADMLVEYMQQSVQIRADALLHHNTGILLEAMPGCGDEHWFSAVKAMAAIPNAALDDKPEEILQAFAPLGMQIVGRDVYTWHCACDSQSMARALAGMVPEQRQEMQNEHGMITVSCRYCGSSYSVKSD